MKKWLAASAAMTSILLTATYPLRAQEEGALSATFNIGQRLESTSNPGLDNPSEGTANFSTTSLGFDLTSQTSTQELSFSAGAVVRAGDIPSGSNISTGFADPRVSIRYSREGYNAAFNISGFFRQSDVSFRDLSQFLDANGNLVVPPDFDDLNGTGQRNTFGFDTSLEIGRDAPLGFTFSAGVNATRYDNVTSASLTDTTRTRLGVTSRLRFSPVTTGRVSLAFDRFEDDDALNTERDTYSLTFGLTNELGNATVVDAEIGVEQIETRETTGNETDTGIVGQLGIQRALTNGSFSASIASTFDQAGDRLTLRTGRSLELPAGTISASLGLTSFEGRSPDVVGSLNWQQALPRSTLSARINRDVTTNSDDEERISTSASVSFTQQINSVSSFGVRANYGLTDNAAVSQTTSQTGITVSYNRSLNETWGYNAGVSYRLRDETGSGSADSTSIFFGLNGGFDLLNRR